MALKVEFQDNTKNVLSELKKVQKQRVVMASVYLDEVVKKTLTGSRKGRIYTKPGTKVKYRASAPGEAPARPTGQLARSVAWQLMPSSAFGGRGVISEVGTPLEKGKQLEFGTKTIEPRPWLWPSFVKARRRIKEIFAMRWM